MRGVMEGAHPHESLNLVIVGFDPRIHALPIEQHERLATAAN